MIIRYLASRDAEFQRWQTLKTNREKRHRARVCFLEGVHPIEQAIKHGWRFEAMACARGARLSGWAKDMLNKSGSPLLIQMPEAMLAELSDRDEPCELVALLHMRDDGLARMAEGAQRGAQAPDAGMAQSDVREPGAGILLRDVRASSADATQSDARMPGADITLSDASDQSADMARRAAHIPSEDSAQSDVREPGADILLWDVRVSGADATQSDARMPGADMALCDARALDTEMAQTPAPAPLYLAFDRPQSPGNLGSVIRSADAFGARGLIITGHAADPYDPQCIRASIGTVFALPFVQLSGAAELLSWLETLPDRPRIVGTSARAPHPISDIDLTGPTLIAVGNETFGLSKAWKDLADDMATIPITGSASSLNVASAASILLYEAARQRGRG